jgi:hypothetical protein
MVTRTALVLIESLEMPRSLVCLISMREKFQLVSVVSREIKESLREGARQRKRCYLHKINLADSGEGAPFQTPTNKLDAFQN